LSDFFEFLNKNSGTLNVVFTAVVTVATAVYAALTWKLVTETRLMREVQTEPRLAVTLQSIDQAIHIVRLHFRNIGQGPAISVKFSPRVETGNEHSAALLEEFARPNFFTTGLSYFGPGQERISMYTQLTQNLDAKLSTVLAFDIEYRSVTGKKYEDTLIVDMSEYKGTHQLGKPYLYSIAQSLEKLQKDVDRLVSGTRIQADVFTEDDRAREGAELDSWMAEHRPEADA
jgi:hypothetical protein